MVSTGSTLGYVAFKKESRNNHLWLVCKNNQLTEVEPYFFQHAVHAEVTCGFVNLGEVRSRAASKMHMCFSFCNTMKLSNCASVLSLQVFDLLLASQNYVDKFQLFLRKKKYLYRSYQTQRVRLYLDCLCLKCDKTFFTWKGFCEQKAFW